MRKEFKPRFFLATRLGSNRLEKCPHCYKRTDVYAPVKASDESEGRVVTVSEE